MNNRQAGRRRGRGGQRPGGNPGRPESGNRIDSRARGNAAQLLEKYKNLARDAQMSGDRVNTEYYLQFADHYFRVLSETRSRFEDNQRRPNEDDEDEFGFEGEIGSPALYQQPAPHDDEREQPRRDARDQGNRRDRGERNDRNRGERPARDERPDRSEAAADAPDARTSREPARRDERPVPANDASDAADAVEEVRAEPRRRGRPRRDATQPVAVNEGFDASVLPPALGIEAPIPEAAVAEPAAEDARPRRRRRVRTDDEAVPPAA